MSDIQTEAAQASKAIGRHARATREQKGISIRKAAQSLGCSPRFVQELERGKPTARMDKVLQALIALGLQVTVHGREERPQMDAQLRERIEARAQQRLREEKLARAHERIAAKLALGEIRPGEVDRARRQVRKWAEHRICSQWYVDRWSEILAGRNSDIAARLLSLDGSEAKALFQNTPFGFLVRDQLRA